MWTLYILRCADGTLYTGITTCLARRLQAHRTGQAARYTRGRGPLDVVYTECLPSRAAATRRELAVKKLTRPAKLALIQEGKYVPVRK